MTKTSLLPCVAAAAALMASAARAEKYHCKFKVPGGNGFVPREVLVDFSAPDTAMVTDAILLHMKDAPKKASFAQNNEKRMRARWEIDDVPSSNGFSVDARYSLVFNKKRGRADVTMQLAGFDNTDAGNGSCTIVE